MITKADAKKAAKARRAGYEAALAAQAEKISILVSSRVLGQLKRTDLTKSVTERVTQRIVDRYLADMELGGTQCVSPTFKRMPDGQIAVGTKQHFVAWLDDMEQRDVEAILKITSEGERGGVHPLDQAKQLQDYFTGTNHNAVTAARTESQKIRTDSRFETYKETKVGYTQYVTAEDDLVRPDHAARNGKIYPINKAPWLGEYNCRCILVPADYQVKYKGAKVEENETVLMPESVVREQYGDNIIIED